MMSGPIVDGSRARGKRDGDGEPRLRSRPGLEQSVPADQRTPERQECGVNIGSLVISNPHAAKLNQARQMSVQRPTRVVSSGRSAAVGNPVPDVERRWTCFAPDDCTALVTTSILSVLRRVDPPACDHHAVNGANGRDISVRRPAQDDEVRLEA